MMGNTLEQNIDRVLAGEIDAYARVIDQFQDEIWRIVAYGLRDIATTEDLVQRNSDEPSRPPDKCFPASALNYVSASNEERRRHEC